MSREDDALLQEYVERERRARQGADAQTPAGAASPEAAARDASHASVEAYRRVFAALEEPPAFALPDDFAQRVAERASRQTASERAWAEWLLGAAAAAIGVMGLVAFGQPALEPAAQRLAAAGAEVIRSIAPARPGLVLAIGLALAAAAALDRLLARRRPEASAITG
jgi:hypothetical protein